MMKDLLWRGMLAGLLAALIGATFARFVAEPMVDAAIAVEAGHEAPGAPDEEVVTRATQKGLGLYTAMALYGTAMGGLFSILFAALTGRAGRIGPRGLALGLGIAAFLVIVLVPALKYPPNPPAVGLHDTIRVRTAAFFGMLALSVASAWGGTVVFRHLAGRLASIDRLLCGVGTFLGLIAIAQAFLPAIDEVPADFPASLLWRFRLASLGTQALFWLATADLFGRLVERLAANARGRVR